MDLYWIAQYNDGTEICSKTSTRSSIDRTRLERFILLQVNNDKPIVVLNMDPGKRLVLRMRHTIGVVSGDKSTVWIAGWQETIKGENRQMISFIFPDGSVEITDGFKKGHSWFYPVIFRPEEQA